MEDRCDSQSWVAGCPGRPFYALLSPVTASEMLLLVFISRALPCGQWQQFQHNLIIPEGNDFQYTKSMILQNGTKRYIISFPATPGLQRTVKILFERKERKKGREKTEREQILIIGSLHLSFSILWQKYDFFFFTHRCYDYFSSRVNCEKICNSQLQHPAKPVRQNLFLELILHCFPRCSDLWLRKSRICPLFPWWFTRELSLIGSDIWILHPRWCLGRKLFTGGGLCEPKVSPYFQFGFSALGLHLSDWVLSILHWPLCLASVRTRSSP